MKPTPRRAWIAALGMIALLGAGIWAKGCLDVDRCLDGGGRWNHERGDCEFE